MLRKSIALAGSALAGFSGCKAVIARITGTLTFTAMVSLGWPFRSVGQGVRFLVLAEIANVVATLTKTGRVRDCRSASSEPLISGGSIADQSFVTGEPGFNVGTV